MFHFPACPWSTKPNSFGLLRFETHLEGFAWKGYRVWIAAWSPQNVLMSFSQFLDYYSRHSNMLH